MNTRFIEECFIGRKGIAEVEQRLGSLVNQVLQHRLAAFCPHPPPHNTAGAPLDHRHDIDFVFLLPIKVNNSSCSTTPTSSGRGGVSGKPLLWALTQLMMV